NEAGALAGRVAAARKECGHRRTARGFGSVECHLAKRRAREPSIGGAGAGANLTRLVSRIRLRSCHNLTPEDRICHQMLSGHVGPKNVWPQVRNSPISPGGSRLLFPMRAM